MSPGRGGKAGYRPQAAVFAALGMELGNRLENLLFTASWGLSFGWMCFVHEKQSGVCAKEKLQVRGEEVGSNRQMASNVEHGFVFNWEMEP